MVTEFQFYSFYCGCKGAYRDCCISLSFLTILLLSRWLLSFFLLKIRYWNGSPLGFLLLVIHVRRKCNRSWGSSCDILVTLLFYIKHNLVDSWLHLLLLCISFFVHYWRIISSLDVNMLFVTVGFLELHPYPWHIYIVTNL